MNVSKYFSMFGMKVFLIERSRELKYLKQKRKKLLFFFVEMI